MKRRFWTTLRIPRPFGHSQGGATLGFTLLESASFRSKRSGWSEYPCVRFEKFCGSSLTVGYPSGTSLRVLALPAAVLANISATFMKLGWSRALAELIGPGPGSRPVSATAGGGAGVAHGAGLGDGVRGTVASGRDPVAGEFERQVLHARDALQVIEPFPRHCT